MAEEELDKNEDATPYKLEEARKKGQVAKSMEFPALFSLLGMLAVLFMTMDKALILISDLVSWWIGEAAYLVMSPQQFSLHFKVFVYKLMSVFFPIAIAGVLAIIVANIAHVGPVFSFFPLKPNFSKLNPAEGFKKIFSRRSIVDLIKLIVKLGMFAIAVSIVFGSFQHMLLNSNHASMNHLLMSWKTMFLFLSVAMLAVFIISALFDLWYSKKDFARQMRMSKRDVKDEHKKREGNPELKAKQKKNLKELLAKVTSTQNIGDADVVITNPTHVAIALKYRSKKMALPIVIAKGKGSIAKMVMQKARKEKVPLMRKPVLARALYQSTDIGEPIPVEMQKNVAEIYRWVLSIPHNKVHSA